jgi:hypothetical protein
MRRSVILNHMQSSVMGLYEERIVRSLCGLSVAVVDDACPLKEHLVARGAFSHSHRRSAFMVCV